MNPGLGFAWTINPVMPGWTPATIDIFTDIGSALHVLLGAIAGSVPPEWSLLIATVFAGYEATKSAGGESWSRIGGTWIEFAIGVGAALVGRQQGWGI